jgi:MerR family transcriptional regulator, thiopeptide resistance regulator
VTHATYFIGEFAARAAVTTRTLRYYDRIGLLSPAQVSEGGQRLYTDAELVKLQQILALKLLGFSLAEISACLAAGPQDFVDALAAQKAMLAEKRRQLDAIIAVIDELEQLPFMDQVQVGQQNGDGAAPASWNSQSATDLVGKLVEMMQMEQKNDWVNQYLTPEQQAAMAELSRTSYSESAQAKVAAWGANWTEADQQRVNAQYAQLAAGLKDAVAQGKPAGSPEVQALATTFLGLIAQFTHGDAEVEQGLATYWQQQANVPQAQRPPLPWGAAEQALLEEAVALQKK